MNSKPTYLLTFLLLFVSFWGALQNVQAQDSRTRLGLSALEIGSTSEFIAEFPEFRKLGISVLELQHPVDERILNAALEQGFQVLVRSDWYYLSTQKLKENRQRFLATSRDLQLKYARFPAVSSIGLYSFSASYDDYFLEELGQLLPLIQQDSTSLTLYEVTSQPSVALSPLFQLSEFDEKPGYDNILLAKEFAKSDFATVSTIFEYSPQVLFFESNWFDDAIQQYPPFKTALAEYASGDDFLIPLPSAPANVSYFNWLILIFVLVLFSAGIHIYASASYKSLIFRYFTYHRFFVDDVMRYRERSGASGIVVLIQHALLFGLMIAILAKRFITPTGLDAFFSNFTFLGILGRNYLSLFFLGTGLALVIEIIGLLWLYVPSKSMRHFSQVINLYAWVFHVDFILLAGILVLYLATNSYIFLLVLSIAFILNWLLAFYLASTDSAGYLFKGKISYILYTFGLHTVINLILLVLFFVFPDFLEVLELSVLI